MLLSDRESPKCNMGNWSVTRFGGINPNEPAAIMVIGKLRVINMGPISPQNQFSNLEVCPFVVYTANNKGK